MGNRKVKLRIKNHRFLPDIQKHGSIPYAELRALGKKPEEIIDFSATVNPFADMQNMLPVVLAQTDLAHYPDPECHNAIAAVADFHGIPSDWIALTAGTTEVLYSLPLLYGKAAQFCPTYGDYQDAYIRHKQVIRTFSIKALTSRFEETIKIVGRYNFKALILCNPNNPTGDYLPLPAIKELSRRLKERIIVIDESYQEMGYECDSASSLLPKCLNLLLLKSLTKPFGIGGIRMGYALSSGDALSRLKRMLLPWGVSSMAQNLVPFLFKNYSFYRQSWEKIHAERTILLKELTPLVAKTFPGRCPFILCKVDNSTALRVRLLVRYGIAVRDCASFGLKNVLRIMTKDRTRNRKLLEALWADTIDPSPEAWTHQKQKSIFQGIN
jgi:histidinol-phosphate/aromatic aminotransferase/cobyric acid decarboxylase-like protein